MHFSLPEGEKAMTRSTLFSPSQLNPGPILSAIDSVSATKGAAVYVSLQKQMRKLRTTSNAGSTVVIELRPPVGTDLSVAPRSSASSPAAEWLNMGLNCGSATISWVGVAGTAAAAPETGGVSAIGTAFLYGGAIASTAQCSISIVRVTDLYDGNQGLNAALDQSQAYRWTMYALDAAGVAGAGYDVLSGGAAVLTSAAKSDLLNFVSDAAGVVTSAVEPGGVIHDSVVWIVSKR
jgi:hypothetical protein